MDQRFHRSVGTLRYSIHPEVGHKVVLEIDWGISLLARALIPVWMNVQPQRYSPHVSVVRKERPRNMAAWGAREGERVPFEYGTWIFDDGVYFWLQVYSERLKEIRAELGLSGSSRVSRPPDGVECFHTTVANRKHRM